MLTNEKLKKIFYNYALHENGEEVDKNEEEVDDILNFFDIVSRIILDDTNYIDINFAAGRKIYIDGCTEYLNEDEKKLVEKVINKIKNNKNC